MSDSPQPLRVGDRERRAVDDQLLAAVGDGVLTLAEYDERSAALWQARTRDELDHLVADLPDHAPVVAAQVPAVPGDVKPRRAVGVMSEERLSGPVAAGQRVQGWAVMGSARIDLRRDDLPARVDVQARAIMGDVEVLVPPGASVHLSGFSVMGDRKADVGEGPGPHIDVDAIAVMGSVRISHGDGTVVRTGRTAASVPLPRPSSVVAPQRHDGHRSEGHLSRVSRAVKRAGALVVPAALLAAVVLAGPDGRAVFGNTTELVSPGESDVRVSRLFGNVTVVVPDGHRVDTGGFALFGNTEREGVFPTGDGPVVSVRSYGAFGNTEIMTQEEWEREQADEAAEDRRKDLQDQREDREDAGD